MRISRCSACLLACAACSWSRESLADSKPVRIDIAAVPVWQAMEEFSHQTSVEYVLNPKPDSLLETLVNPVHSWSITPEDGLAEMLRCTGLTYQFKNERSVVVNAAEPDAPGQSCDNNGLPQVFVNAPRTRSI